MPLTLSIVLVSATLGQITSNTRLESEWEANSFRYTVAASCGLVQFQLGILHSLSVHPNARRAAMRAMFGLVHLSMACTLVRQDSSSAPLGLLLCNGVSVSTR